MVYRKRICQAASFLLAAGIAAGTMAIDSQAAVITSNATDKVAAVFQEGTEYSAGDYVIYDGEMYVCTQEIQGAWSQAEASFLQVTKNRELGTSGDLSAAYAEEKDPSQETSLMAFAANAWQKLKGFLGIGSRDAQTDASGYANASVSAKLNYLEQQNQMHSDNLGKLQESVNDSFLSVSNGKALVAGAITDNGGTASPQDTFLQLSESVRDLAKAKYDTGYSKGHDTGYDSGHKDGFQEGHDKGFGEGSSAGHTEGYEEGIRFADGRVNEASESYRQGLDDGKKEGGNKSWNTTIRLMYDGPDILEECFTYKRGFSENHRAWTFEKDIGPCEILGISCIVSYTDSYGSSVYWDMSVKNDEEGTYDRLTRETDKFCDMTFDNGRIRIGDINMNILYSSRAVCTIKLNVIYK